MNQEEHNALCDGVVDSQEVDAEKAFEVAVQAENLKKREYAQGWISVKDFISSLKRIDSRLYEVQTVCRDAKDDLFYLATNQREEISSKIKELSFTVGDMVKQLARDLLLAERHSPLQKRV